MSKAHVEREASKILNQKVGGSNPSSGTQILELWQNGRHTVLLVWKELTYRFESCQFHEETKNQIGIMEEKIFRHIAYRLSVQTNDVSCIYYQIAKYGKLTAMLTSHFNSIGLPIVKELSKVLNKSMIEVKQLINDGQITDKHVGQALISFTSEGGIFYDMDNIVNRAKKN